MPRKRNPLLSVSGRTNRSVQRSKGPKVQQVVKCLVPNRNESPSDECVSVLIIQIFSVKNTRSWSSLCFTTTVYWEDAPAHRNISSNTERKTPPTLTPPTTHTQAQLTHANPLRDSSLYWEQAKISMWSWWNSDDLNFLPHSCLDLELHLNFDLEVSGG